MAPHTILDTPDDFLKNLFAVNVLSNWYTVKAFLPAMVARNKGHIVTVASLASYVGIASLADYTASKAAILSFHEGKDNPPALETTVVLQPKQWQTNTSCLTNSTRPRTQAPSPRAQYPHHVRPPQLGAHATGRARRVGAAGPG